MVNIRLALIVFIQTVTSGGKNHICMPKNKAIRCIVVVKSDYVRDYNWKRTVRSYNIYIYIHTFNLIITLGATNTNHEMRWRVKFRFSVFGVFSLLFRICGSFSAD